MFYKWECENCENIDRHCANCKGTFQTLAIAHDRKLYCHSCVKASETISIPCKHCNTHLRYESTFGIGFCLTTNECKLCKSITCLRCNKIKTERVDVWAFNRKRPICFDCIKTKYILVTSGGTISMVSDNMVEHVHSTYDMEEP
jgi:hypothetical protein